MGGDGDSADDERLLVGRRREQTTLLAGSELGLTRIDVAAAQVGEFSLLERGTVRDLAADGSTLLVAADEDVFRRTSEGLEPLGFGPAAAVGIDGEWVYAAGDRVARRGRESGDEWETVGTVERARRFVGDLLAADRLVRVGESLESGPLEEVHDISRDGSLVATATGLFDRDGRRLLDGTATAVVADGERAHAVVDGHLYEREGGAWLERDVPGTEPCRLAYGQALAVLDSEGTIHVAADPELTRDGGGGWRSRAIGLRGVTALLAL